MSAGAGKEPVAGSCDREGTAVVLCEGAFGTSDGKTAHGLVRHTTRYEVLAVIDSRCAGEDAGTIIDGSPCGIPVVRDLDQAIAVAGRTPDYLVVGVATHGGVLPASCRPIVRGALEHGLNVDSGLHELLGDDQEFVALARTTGARIRDVRRTPPRAAMHPFTGGISGVRALRIAVLGTDSGVGKRTTAVRLVQGLNAAGARALMIGTGQTAWMQGTRYGLILDSLVNDFVSGEIEHQICLADREQAPDAIVIEGQGCLTNPAYPGGFEILAGGRPQAIVLQHAPARTHYDGFPEFPLAGVDREMAILALLSPAPVVAVTLNHEGLTPAEVERHAAELGARLRVPCCDPLLHGVEPVLAELRRRFPRLPA
ncbi:MAG TPA: DUF1611 domain-containing protein [Candidatus Polarisedimenticolia bacterium]|nr:DUF1611 domain-containing protein [Candidatus Polarisedimenticolia bacterium]